MQELNNRFSEEAIEILTLGSCLIPNGSYQAFNATDICKLVEKYYPLDFTKQEKINLRFQLQYFILDAPHNPTLKNLSTLSELCRALVETGKSEVYFLLDRLIRLILTLSVSTATTEQAFSAMKLVKTRLRNKMEDEYLTDNVVVHIEKKIIENFDLNSIIDDFKGLKKRKVAF